MHNPCTKYLAIRLAHLFVWIISLLDCKLSEGRTHGLVSVCGTRIRARRPEMDSGSCLCQPRSSPNICEFTLFTMRMSSSGILSLSLFFFKFHPTKRYDYQQFTNYWISGGSSWRIVHPGWGALKYILNAWLGRAWRIYIQSWVNILKNAYSVPDFVPI